LADVLLQPVDPVPQVVDSRRWALIPIVCVMGRATMGDPGRRPSLAGHPVTPGPTLSFLRSLLLCLTSFIQATFGPGFLAPHFLLAASLARGVRGSASQQSCLSAQFRHAKNLDQKK
jgi:hypothetical protein